jgi:hypothetical protein
LYVTTTALQRWAGPRASGLVLKYNQFLGAEDGLKRNSTQDVAENEQDTGTEMADVS